MYDVCVWIDVDVRVTVDSFGLLSERADASEEDGSWGMPVVTV